MEWYLAVGLLVLGVLLGISLMAVYFVYTFKDFMG